MDREKDGSDLESWRPLVLEDVEADSAELVCSSSNTKYQLGRKARNVSARLADVRVVELGEEADLGGRHGVLLGKEELELEQSTCIIKPKSARPFLKQTTEAR